MRQLTRRKTEPFTPGRASFFFLFFLFFVSDVTEYLTTTRTTTTKQGPYYTMHRVVGTPNEFCRGPAATLLFFFLLLLHQTQKTRADLTPDLSNQAYQAIQYAEKGGDLMLLAA
jgi:hypothetical protein